MEYQWGYLVDKPSDFKICKQCSAINWYENDSCVMCNNNEFYTDIKIVKYVIEREYKYRTKIAMIAGIHFCDECEIEV